MLYNHIVHIARTKTDPTTRTSCTTLLTELAWREFRHHIAFHFPTTMTEAFQEKRRHIVWDCPTEWIERWEQGMT
jgi:deoxyribodipyrimidine photo-lyase